MKVFLVEKYIEFGCWAVQHVYQAKELAQIRLAELKTLYKYRNDDDFRISEWDIETDECRTT